MEEKAVGPCNRNQGEQRAHPPSPSSLIQGRRRARALCTRAHSAHGFSSGWNLKLWMLWQMNCLFPLHCIHIYTSHLPTTRYWSMAVYSPSYSSTMLRSAQDMADVPLPTATLAYCHTWTVQGLGQLQLTIYMSLDCIWKRRLGLQQIMSHKGTRDDTTPDSEVTGNMGRVNLLLLFGGRLHVVVDWSYLSKLVALYGFWIKWF
jgi:hypothetical protein